MLDYIIRECALSDAQALSRLNRDELGYDYSPELTSEKLNLLLSSASDKLFVSETDNTVIGYIHANDYDLLYAPHMKNIMGIAVSSSYRKHGIGRALLQKVEEWAISTGAESVRLVSGSERKDAHEFYKKCGYAQNKEQLNFRKPLK